MNVLETTIAHLADALDVPVAVYVPKKRVNADAYVTVERAGGAATKVDDHASLTIQVWHKDRLAIEDFASDTVDALLGMPDAVTGVYRVEVSKSYYPSLIPDYCPRYVLACDVYSGK